MKNHQYREEIQKRTINPSSDSWEKLSGKLDAIEQHDKRKKWPYISIASAILILISIGVYFYQPKEQRILVPEIVGPSSQEKIIKNPQKIEEPETEIASTPEQTSAKEYEQDIPIKEDSKEEQIAFIKISEPREKTELKVTPLVLEDTLLEAPRIAENNKIEETDIDHEIDQLLHESKIQLIYNGAITSKKLVNSNALLNSVEDDLDKSLKERLIEKIATTLKKDKEVATSK